MQQLKSNLVIHVENTSIANLECKVLAINSLGADVHEVILQLPAGCQPDYRPGQYLLLASLHGPFSPFSIASAPAEEGRLRLHILAANDEPASLLAGLKADAVARVQLPFGEVRVDVAQSAPLLLIAAGTGLAQMRSIVEQARLQGSRRPIHLYWGARTGAELYRLGSGEQWQQLPNLHFHQVVSHDPDWPGRKGLLYEAVVSDLPDLSAFEVIASGSPAMVYGTLDALVAHGMQPQQMQADVFSYAPRPE